VRIIQMYIDCEIHKWTSMLIAATSKCGT